MSTASSPAADVAALDHALNQRVLTGDMLGAFEEFYAEDVVMMENDQAFTGKAVNREREKKFLEGIQEIHSGAVVSNAVAGDRSFTEWDFDMTFHGGMRMRMQEVAVRQWKDGKVVHERFFYKGQPS